MIPIRNRASLVKRLEEVRLRPPEKKPRLLSFFLIDERSSHRAVKAFVDSEYKWLDSLAGSSNIIILFFRENLPSQTNNDDDVLVLGGSAKASNPSLEVAARFGITPDQLPGVVFFRDLDFTSDKPTYGIYRQLSTESMQGDPAALEREIAELFAAVQEAGMKSRDTDSMLTLLELAIGRSQWKNDRMQVSAASKGALKIVSYPGKLLEAVVLAFAPHFGEPFPSKYS